VKTCFLRSPYNRPNGQPGVGGRGVVADGDDAAEKGEAAEDKQEQPQTRTVYEILHRGWRQVHFKVRIMSDVHGKLNLVSTG
jgi:hypothetical protein